MSTPIGKILDHQAKHITYNVYTYFKARKMESKGKDNPETYNLINTVSKVTGLSKSTVTRIIQAGNAMKKETGTVKFVPQENKQVRKKRIEIDEFTEGTIRRKVIQFYTNTNEVPSVRKLNAMLKKENIIDCSNEYLRKLLHNLGFTKSDSSNEVIMGRSDIVSLRFNYLQAIRDYRSQQRNIFFINKTKYWNRDDKKDTLNNPDMPSIIAIPFKGKIGFKNNETVIVKSKINTDDDHDEQVEDVEWIKGNVLPNIPSFSVIVLNSPKAVKIDTTTEPKPHQAATRVVMQNWLKKNNIPFKDTDHKAQLFSLINNIDKLYEYSFDKILTEAGHDILHLPENHPDLNPVQIAWNKNTESEKPVATFSRISGKVWQNCFEAVINNENEYYNHDLNFDATVDNLLSMVKKEDSDDDVQSDSNSSDDKDMDCESS